MITIQTQSDGVLFNFQDSTRYLYGDGSILTPYNSLTLIADESNVLTFRKSASNDIFITAGYDELGYSSKEEAINDLKTKLFKPTGGGSESGITPSEVQTMIDESISGKADTATVNQIANEAAQAILSVSGDVQTNASNIADIWDTIDDKEEVIASALTEVRQDVAEIDAKEEVIASALTEVRQDVNKKAGVSYVDFWGMFNDSFEMDDAKWYEMIEAYDNNAIFYAIPNDDYSSTASPLTVEYIPEDELWFNLPWGNGYTSLILDRIDGRDGYEYKVANATEFNIYVDDHLVSGSTNPVQNAVITQALENKLDASAYTPTDLSQYWTSAQTQTAIDGVKGYYISFATIATTGIRDEDWDGIVAAIDDHRPIYAGYPRSDGGILYYGVECMNKNVSNTQIVLTSSDNSAHYFYTFTKNGSNDYSYTVSTKPYVTDAEKVTWNAKQDALSAGTGIEISGNVISATGGGGATYSAGTNISIANDTINCTLPIEKVLLKSWSEDNSQCLWIKPTNVKIWIDQNRPTANYLNDVRPAFSFGLNYIKGGGNPAAFGQMNNVNGFDSFATGGNNNTNNNYEFATGAYNNSVTGSTASGQTLFSVGNGTADNARHNAFEIRQNGDIYVNDGTNDVRLQDTILALGGLKLVQCTQAEYDALVSGGTVDSSTIYFISNVVS